MAFYSGLDGQLYLNNRKVGKVQNWSLNATQAVLDTTCLEDTDRTLINGVRSASGSCRVFYHSSGNASDFIDNIIKPGAQDYEAGSTTQSQTVTFKLNVDANKYVEVFAWITGVTMGSAVGEVTAVDVTFEVSGHAKSQQL
nr:hypothetical protein 12 [bacterium]